MSSVITVENLGKRYTLKHQVGSQPYVALRDVISDGVKNLGSRLFGKRLRSDAESGQEEFWALKDVFFEVKQGDRLGIIGRNGAGKSTLLKILSRITEPTTGSVRIKGRVASLLEVGTGFHPELTGRENVFLNGAILGMSRMEIKKKFDEIVDFAEIEKFLDTPVKRYSSGMYVRLAFAVAAHLEPEVLIIDEVLAVGDAQFQKKCLGKMEQVGKQGRTVLFVSHQMDMIRALCEKAILLDRGMIAVYGDTGEVIENYLKPFSSEEERTSFQVPADPRMPIQFISGRIVGQDGRTCSHFDVFDRIILEFEYAVNREAAGLVLSFELLRNGSTLFMSFDADIEQTRLKIRTQGMYKSRVEFPTPLLKSGLYTITLRTGVINIVNYQVVEEILCFNVDLISKPSTFLSYAERRPGILAIPLPWKTESVEGAHNG